MLHQILSDCYFGTFSKTKKGWWWFDEMVDGL